MLTTCSAAGDTRTSGIRGEIFGMVWAPLWAYRRTAERKLRRVLNGRRGGSRRASARGRLWRRRRRSSRRRGGDYPIMLHVPHGLEDYPYCTSRERRRCDRPHGEARSNRKGHHACRDVTIFSTILLMTSAVAGCALRFKNDRGRDGGAGTHLSLFSFTAGLSAPQAG